MKNEKVNFKNIKDVLSRDEMKSITGGIRCAFVMFDEIAGFGSCSGDSWSICELYCADMGFTYCNCR